jgi:aminopeptidase YwaD
LRRRLPWLWFAALLALSAVLGAAVMPVAAQVGTRVAQGEAPAARVEAQAAPGGARMAQGDDAAQTQLRDLTFSGAAAKRQVEALGDQIGSRPAGSTNYDQAVQYTADQLRQWGYQPVLQSFPVETYDDRGSKLEVTSSAGTTERPVPDTLVYSIGGQVDGPLVAAGLGQPEDFAAVDARGKVALIKRGTLRFGDKVANAAAAGASGVVVYNDAPGRLQGGSLGASQPIPAAAISNDDGQRLADQLAAGTTLTVNLSVDANVVHGSSTNVVAELPADGPQSAARAGGGTAREVVIGAHLDSVAAGPGANDDGSGSAVLLELARTLAQAPTAARPYGVTFVLFGAEELGLYGSRYYVANLSDADRQSITAMINLDMVGVGQAWRFGGSDDLVQSALGVATDLGERGLPLRGPLGSASDHASFQSAGIPALFLYRTDDPNYHTANDRAEYVDADVLGQAGTIALRVMDGLARQ